MPSFTAERPHAITCIKWSVRDLLRDKCGDDLTVSCDRDDCWQDAELFKYRQAVNIVSGFETIGTEPYKNPRQARKLSDERTEADSQCLYKSSISIDLQIYVEQCDDCEDDDDCSFSPKDKAYSILGHLQSVLFSNQSQIAGRRIKYLGSNPTTQSENELDVAVVTANFEIEYLFDPTQTWAVR